MPLAAGRVAEVKLWELRPCLRNKPSEIGAPGYGIEIAEPAASSTRDTDHMGTVRPKAEHRTS
jgi:hypothetical protein